MTRLFIGHKPSVGPVVKIMKNDGDDPLTTANNQHSKYLFNSETSRIGYIDDIFIRTFMTSITVKGTWVFTPGGSNMANCQSAVFRQDSGNGYDTQVFRFAKSYFGSYFPLFEERRAMGDNKNVFLGPGTLTQDTDGGWFQGISLTFTNSGGRVANQAAGSNWRAFFETSPVPTGDRWRQIISLWDLPANNTALPSIGSPSSGQEVVRVSPSMARVAKPGFTVTNGSPKNFILHEDYIPAKIMAAGEISVPATGSKQATITVPASFTLTPQTYMDYHVRRDGSEWYNQYFFSPPLIYNSNENDGIGFTYQVNASSVVITNRCRFPIVVRYAIFADSDAATTSGGSAIMRKTGNAIQIKRPGSSDSAPALNDIMLDTRLAYFPLLKEGYLPWPGGFPSSYGAGEKFYGEKYVDVAVDNPTGVKLFVKHRLIFPASTGVGGVTYDEEIFEPVVSVMTNAGATWTGRMTAYSSYARIATDEKSVRFSMAGDNPFYATGVYWRVAPAGIRYFIFGIPDL